MKTETTTSGLRDPEVQELLDKQSITEVLMRYCRGIDRLDLSTIEAAFWPDAHDDHVVFSGSAPEFVKWVPSFIGNSESMSHMITNVLISFDSPIAARCESYVWTFQHHPDEQPGGLDVIITGRYLDRFAKRGREWRIADRILTIDTQQRLPSTADWGPTGVLANLKTRGTRYPHDALYSRLLNVSF